MAASALPLVDERHMLQDGLIPVVRRRSRSSLSSVGWLPKDDIDAAEWEAQGRWLGSIGRCSAWWIGDWVRFGTTRYGEKYKLAAKLTGYEQHSLRNMAYVASRFPELSRRRQDLSFSHRAEVAALQADEQDRWLDRAQAQRLSVLALRRMIAEQRAARKAPQAQQPQQQDGQDPDDEAITCPSCGHTFKPAERPPS
ncbi:MAG: hypothetical protein ACYCUM_07745 [Solirubrobacteraceae bacterium]